MRSMMVILAAVAALIAGAPPAVASGGWALTYLDPVPAGLTPGTSYTIGFWVLQHGTHPYEGDLGPTALRLTAADGAALDFPGTPLPEPGHYAAAVNVPEGAYTLTGVQGIFQPYEIGTLAVPGGVEVNPLDPDLIQALRQPGVDYWGAIRPPGIPDVKGVPDATPDTGTQADRETGTSAVPETGTSAVPRTGTSAVPETGTSAVPGTGAEAGSEVDPADSGAVDFPGTDQAGADAEDADSATGGIPPYTLLLAAAGGAVLTLALRRPRRGRDADPPVDDKTDTIVISG